MAKNANNNQSSYKDRVILALESEDTLLAEIWKYEAEHGRGSAKDTQENVRPQKSASFVYSYRPIIDAIIDRKVPDTPLTAGRIVKPLKNFVKRHKGGSLDGPTVLILNDTIDSCSEIAENEKLKEREDLAGIASTEKCIETLKNQKISGIYVYTYPHYRRYPVKEGSENAVERTLFKIGQTSKDIEERIYQQTHTHVPESPILLRMYISDDSKKPSDLESDFHDIVNAAHPYERGKGVGVEWFLTNLELLDVFAEQKRLEIIKPGKDVEDT